MGCQKKPRRKNSAWTNVKDKKNFNFVRCASTPLFALNFRNANFERSVSPTWICPLKLRIPSARKSTTLFIKTHWNKHTHAFEATPKHFLNAFQKAWTSLWRVVPDLQMPGVVSTQMQSKTKSKKLKVKLKVKHVVDVCVLWMGCDMSPQKRNGWGSPNKLGVFPKLF